MTEGFLIFQTIAEIIILVSGTIGNVLVVLVIAKKRKMRTVTNYLILNLACADLTVLISNIPVDLTTRFSNRWVFGKAMCRILKPLQTMGTIASILTLVAISLSRYHAIVYPFNRQMKLSHARIVLVAIWIVSLAVVTPYAMACSYNPIEQICEEDFQNIGMSTKAYTLTMFVLQYVLPMTGMTYAYNRIGAELNSQQCRECGTLMDPEYRRDTKKVVKMLSIVVAVFAVLDLPIHIVFIWKDFDSSVPEYIFYLASLLLYGNSFVNPIIYSICNDQFRKGFRDLIGSCLQACTFLMKITGSAKPERDRTFPGSQHDSPCLQDDIKDGRVLTNVHGNREASKKNGVRIELEISNSGSGGRCGELSGQRKLTLMTGVSKQENAVDESAV